MALWTSIVDIVAIRIRKLYGASCFSGSSVYSRSFKVPVVPIFSRRVFLVLSSGVVYCEDKFDG